MWSQSKRENSSLPVAVRISKTRVLKLPIYHWYHLALIRTTVIQLPSVLNERKTRFPMEWNETLRTRHDSFHTEKSSNRSPKFWSNASHPLSRTRTGRSLWNRGKYVRQPASSSKRFLRSFFFYFWIERYNKRLNDWPRARETVSFVSPWRQRFFRLRLGEHWGSCLISAVSDKTKVCNEEKGRSKITQMEDTQEAPVSSQK